MNEPHKPKLTDYLTEALAKSLTEEGRQSLLEPLLLIKYIIGSNIAHGLS